MGMMIEDFLFLASLSTAFVFLASDAEGRVISFKDEVVVRAAAEKLVGAVSSGMTNAVTLAISSGTTLSIALSVSSGATSSVALAVSSVDKGAVSLACVVGGGVDELDGSAEPNLAASLLLWSSTTLAEAVMNCL